MRSKEAQEGGNSPEHVLPYVGLVAGHYHLHLPRPRKIPQHLSDCLFKGRKSRLI